MTVARKEKKFIHQVSHSGCPYAYAWISAAFKATLVNSDEPRDMDFLEYISSHLSDDEGGLRG
jgi:hypothetical protein